MATERIQKLLAAAGFGSRRACEELIVEGRVAVNGHVLRQLPVLVDPEVDRVTVDGKPVRPERKVYFVLHKPRNVVCTNSDPDGRTRAIDLLPGVRERVFPVGRLDAESTGLLLLTNDGAMAERLAHPRYGVPKTYRAEVAGRLDDATLDRIRRGVWLSDGRTGQAEAEIIHRREQSTIVEITLREGRNREVRRILAKLGHKVYRLMRIRIGPLSLRKLPLGAARSLNERELASLKRFCERPIPPHPAAAALTSRPRAWQGKPARRTAGAGDRSDRWRGPGRGPQGRLASRRRSSEGRSGR